MEPKANNKKDYLIIASLTTSLFLIWSGFYFSYPDFFKLKKEAEQLATQKINEQKQLAQTLAFTNLNLEAKAFVVYDVETGTILASQNENQVLPLASITKVMTVLVASDEPENQKMITKAINPETSGLLQGEHWQLASLAALTLVSSSNEGASALAGNNQKTFVNKMNEKAKNIGLTDLYFTNPTGLDDKPTPGGQGSALSVAKLFTYAFKNKPDLFTPTKESLVQEKSDEGLNHIALNTNEIIDEVPGLLISKTGYTDRAGGNLGIIANLGLNRPVAVIVLGSSEKGRFTDTKKLVEATLNYYSNLN
jgi:serine-type D-Ala-D-Ala carboxypeptidase (penicillin-binding protein 5/6)